MLYKRVCNSPGSVDVKDSKCAVTTDSATPPGITQGCQLSHTRTTIRIPDYDKMRNTCPDEWIKELRNPSLVLVVPNEFAMPLPTRSMEINRENISAIVDQVWECCEGGVLLVKTNHITAIDNHAVSTYV